MESNILESVSKVTEFNDLCAYMNDPDLDEALSLVIKLIVKPDVPASKAPELIVRLQALSAKFAMLKRYYMTFEKGTEASIKKNTYASAADAIDKLVAALKYSVKTPY
ncbi:MAG: hypothetical protein EBU08_18085 [Micrococcales bacterium]|nr:hypothetical protein [Micrococcales bacterium]